MQLSRTLRSAVIAFVIAGAGGVGTLTDLHAEDADQKAFFQNLSELCGRQFEGATEFPQNADHPLVGKKLLISFEQCSGTELRIPLQAGEDKSRTWIVTLNLEGLLLKHDHRHPDGTQDKVTMYGGLAIAGGTRHRQRFAADAATAKLLPEAATNVWTLEINPEKQQLIYALERHQQPRYQAVFKLNSGGK